MKSTWRFVVKIVGASLALAGVICLLVGYWSELASCCRKRRKCGEYADYDDDGLFE